MSDTMDDGDGSAAAFEAALGQNPRQFVNDVDDIHRHAFQFARELRPLRISSPLASVICYSPSFAAGLVVTCRCRLHFSRESATAGVLGAAKVAQMAEELDRVSSVLRYYYIWAD
jgi:hypothetical protein